MKITCCCTSNPSVVFTLEFISIGGFSFISMICFRNYSHQFYRTEICVLLYGKYWLLQSLFSCLHEIIQNQCSVI